ncbi:MAG: GTP cyclohydrolase II [Rothia sp. (in: high G+C Gram-positive bacteria)]|nr:GTP cyclohydrolase II [Rothia sp. (in: high G+C Gram-positive bacteria)]
MPKTNQAAPCVLPQAGAEESQLTEKSQPVLVPTAHGTFLMQAFGFVGGVENLALTAADADGKPLASEQPPLVRLHSECATGDIFGSYRCDCGPQLHQALAIMAAGGGTLLYLRGQEGRGIGLVNKLRAYALQDDGMDTLDANLALGLPADARSYAQAAAMLAELGMTSIRLMTNNPAKAEALTALGIEVTELVPDEIAPRPENARYLATKRDRMRHHLSF